MFTELVYVPFKNSLILFIASDQFHVKTCNAQLFSRFLIAFVWSWKVLKYKFNIFYSDKNTYKYVLVIRFSYFKQTDPGNQRAFRSAMFTLSTAKFLGQLHVTMVVVQYLVQSS